MAAAAAPSVDDLISRNSKYAETYTKSHSVEEVTKGVIKFPSVIIVSCCDPRLIPEEYGLFSREEYVVVRNAGGRAEPAIRDIAVLTAMTEITDVVIIHHVDCGLTHLTNSYIRSTLKERGLGDEGLATRDFGEITDLKQSVLDDLAYLKASPYIPKSMKLHGYVHDMLDTGRLIKV